MCATVACTSFPSCLWSFYICSIKVIFRFVCLSLTQTSVSSIAFDGWISLTFVCENTAMFPQGGTSLLICFSKLYSPSLGDVTEDMQQSLAAALVSGLMKNQNPHCFRNSGLAGKMHPNFISWFLFLLWFSWKVKSCYVSSYDFWQICLADLS